MEREAFERARSAYGTGAYDDATLEFVFPQLKESEDERIRKRLINLIKELATNKVPILTGGYFVDGQDKKYIAWLEKQKEQKKETLRDFIEDFPYSAQKEQKPAEWSEEDEEMLNSCISSIEESKENRYAYKETDGDTSYDREVDWLKSLPKRFTLQSKQEWNEEDYSGFLEEDKKYMEKYIPLDKVTLVKLLAERDRNIAESLESFTSVEQEKQKWSEEDEKMKESIIKALYGGRHFAYESEITWLKSLPLNLKKKNEDVAKLCSNEWSEDDEKIRKWCISHFKECFHASKDNLEFKQYLNNKIIPWLNSPHPLPKQIISEDTEVLMAKLVNLLKSYRIGEETATTLANRIAGTYGAQRYMDGLCDGEKLHWKPSEEQMDSLRDTIIQTKGYSYSMYLPELYEQLKKLM